MGEVLQLTLFTIFRTFHGLCHGIVHQSKVIYNGNTNNMCLYIGKVMTKMFYYHKTHHVINHQPRKVIWCVYVTSRKIIVYLNGLKIFEPLIVRL